MKSVVLLSAGMDSAVNLYAAAQKGQVLLALTFNYGQKAAAQEMKKAQALAQSLDIPHKVLDLSFFKDFGRSSLIVEKMEIPSGSQVQMDDLQQSQKTAQSVWVPNRNGIFLNIAAGFAEALEADCIVPGFNKEEAATFPDNSSDFMLASTKAFSFSTNNKVQVQCFTTALDKTQIVKMGKELDLDFSKIWPCYHSFQKWCGQCESCQRSRRAFKANNIESKDWFLP